MRPIALPQRATLEALGDRVVVPGQRVGSVRIGTTYGEIRALLGAGQCSSCRSLALVRYPEVGLEVAVTTPAGQGVTPASSLTAIGIRGDLVCFGPVRLQAHRDEIDASLGPPMMVGQHALYADGVSVHFDERGRVLAFTVVAPLAPSLFPRLQLRPLRAQRLHRR